VKFLVVAVALALTVLAPPPAAGKADRLHETGYLAFAEFVSTDSSGCVVTALPLYLRDGHLDYTDDGGGPGHPRGPFLDIDTLVVRNECNGEVLLEAYGSTTAFNLRVKPQLAAATLTARVPMFDCHKVICDCEGEGCPTPTFVLDLDLTWTADGEIQRMGEGANGLHEHFHDIISGDVRNVSVTGVTREMVVTGTATDGAMNYAPEPSASAELRRWTLSWVNARRGD
jgi:hypothetical protein